MMHAETRAGTETITLGVAGMTCLSCVARIEGALQDLPGVVSAAADLVHERVVVTYDPGDTGAVEMGGALHAIGYRVKDPGPAGAGTAAGSPTRPAFRPGQWIAKYWFALFSLGYGLFVGLPFLAPVLMRIGWDAPGRAIYFFYTFFCHQLPQRSFFLFGPQGMYDLASIQAAWEPTLNPLVLRQFIGEPGMGWKVAWSDRMVSMYTSILLFAWLWYPLRKRICGLPLWGLVLLSLPVFVDGSTHMLSDLAGIGQGFRDSNAWLAALTGEAFPPGFYAGDALGSFNSWMRLLTGTLAGLGIVWYGFPHIEETIRPGSRSGPPGRSPAFDQ